MIKGYGSELQARQTEMDIMKLDFEQFYMRPEDDATIENSPEIKAIFETASSKLEGYMQSLAGTIRSVKLAVDPWNQI